MDSAVLDNKDRPSGTIVAGALSIGWLQEALDYFVKKFPFSADLKTATISIALNDTTFALPSDFILDYNNGLVLADDKGRMRRRSLGYILNRNTTTTGTPKIYAIKGSTAHFWPKADKAYTATLYYYYLDTVLGASTVPVFPDDWILTNYVWLKAREWHRVEPVGTAMAFADQRIAELQKSGIGNEAEEDQLNIDPDFAGQPNSDTSGWMGPVVT